MTDDKRPITPDDKIAIEDSPGAVVAPAPPSKSETAAPAVACAARRAAGIRKPAALGLAARTA